MYMTQLHFLPAVPHLHRHHRRRPRKPPCSDLFRWFSDVSFLVPNFLDRWRTCLLSSPSSVTAIKRESLAFFMARMIELGVCNNAEENKRLVLIFVNRRVMLFLTDVK